MKKNTKTTFKLIALFLMFAMMFCMLPLSAFALEDGGMETSLESTQSSSASPSQGESSAEESISSSSSSLGIGELTAQELATMEVNAEDIPEVIPMARAVEKGLVNRLYAQEDSLSTVLFQTRSGGKTAYVFGKPVKYVDAEGNVQDKSTAISAMLDTTYAYAMLDNSVKVYFPKSITSGVLLAYNGYSITMTPEVSGRFTPIYNEESNAMGYAGVFGSTSILAYTPTLYGVKEDIVLVKYEGKNSFDFLMTVQGLTAVKDENGIWELRNGEGKTVANLGNVVVKDSAGNTAYGELSVVSLGNSQYRVTVTAPEEFLQASDTVYPVYVDPAVNVSEQETRVYSDEDQMEYYETVDTIIDVGLYQSSVDYNGAISRTDSHILGSAMDNSRVIYKLYDFYGEHGWFTDLSANQIGSVTLHVNAYEVDAITVTAVPMTATWSGTTIPVALLESSANLWSSVNTAYGTGTLAITSNGSYAFDITQIVRGWASYNQGVSTAAYHNPENGFCLMTDDNDCVRLTSTEASGDNNVYYEIDYSIYSEPSYLVSKINTTRYQSLQKYYDGEDSIFVIDDFSANIDSQWIFEYLGTNSAGVERYRIYSAANNEYLRVLSGSYVSSGTVMSPENIWLLESATGGYRIRSEYSPTKYLHNNNGSLGLTTNQSSAGVIWEMLEESDFVALEDFKLNAVHIPKGTTQQLSAVNLTDGATHTNNSYFHFALESGSNFTITSSGSITAPNADNRSAYVTVTHKYTGAERTIGVFTTKDRRIVRHAQYDGYIDIYPDSNDLAVLPFGKEPTMLWLFILNNDGTYCIMNAQNQTFVGVENNSHVNGASIIETTYPVKWTVSYYNTDSSGNDQYKFVSTEDSSLSIGMDNSTDYLKLTSSQYGWNKWILEPIIYEAYVSVSYDKAYATRNFNAKVRINDIMAEVRKHYYVTFGIWLEISEPEFRYSVADNCGTAGYKKGGTYYDNDCSCSEDKTERHKYASNVLGEVCDRTDENIISISFIGHKLWSIKDGVYGVYSLGLALETGKSCIVMCSDKEPTYNDYPMKETFTAIHEIGHLYGTDDHYNTEFKTEKDECTHGYHSLRHEEPVDNYFTNHEVLVTRPYCTDCLAVIQSNRGIYNP